MNQAAISLIIYGVYLLANGAALLLAPNTALGLLGLPPAGEPWARLFGLLAAEVGFYFITAARKDLRAFYQATIYGRWFAAFVFVVLVLLKLGPLQLLLFSAVDLLTALWTYRAIKQVRKA